MQKIKNGSYGFDPSRMNYRRMQNNANLVDLISFMHDLLDRVNVNGIEKREGKLVIKIIEKLCKYSGIFDEL